MADEIRVEGLEELRDVLLKRLPENLQGKALQKALALAAKPIVATAKSLAPVKSGRLKRAIYSFRDRQSTKTREGRLISVKRGKRFQKSDRDAYYWPFIEFGRAVVKAQRGKSLGNEKAGFFGRTVSAVPPKPFMRPAFESNKAKALEIVRTELAGQIDKVAKQAVAKSARRLRKATIGF